MLTNIDKIRQSASEEFVEKKKWIKPDIDVHDFVEMTQTSVSGHGEDGEFDYS